MPAVGHMLRHESQTGGTGLRGRKGSTDMSVQILCKSCGMPIQISDAHCGRAVRLTCPHCGTAQRIVVPDKAREESSDFGEALPFDDSDLAALYGTHESGEGAASKTESRSPAPAVTGSAALARTRLMGDIAALERRIPLLQASLNGLQSQVGEDVAKEATERLAEAQRRESRPGRQVKRLLTGFALAIVTGNASVGAGYYAASGSQSVPLPDESSHPLSGTTKSLKKELRDAQSRVATLRRLAKSPGLLLRLLNSAGPGLVAVTCFFSLATVAEALTLLYSPAVGCLALLLAGVAVLAVWHKGLRPLYYAARHYRRWPSDPGALPTRRWHYLGACGLVLVAGLGPSYLVMRSAYLGLRGSIQRQEGPVASPAANDNWVEFVDARKRFRCLVPPEARVQQLEAASRSKIKFEVGGAEIQNIVRPVRSSAVTQVDASTVDEMARQFVEFARPHGEPAIRHRRIIQVDGVPAADVFFAVTSRERTVLEHRSVKLVKDGYDHTMSVGQDRHRITEEEGEAFERFLSSYHSVGAEHQD